jgi:hypothetical protein
MEADAAGAYSSLLSEQGYQDNSLTGGYSAAQMASLAQSSNISPDQMSSLSSLTPQAASIFSATPQGAYYVPYDQSLAPIYVGADGNAGEAGPDSGQGAVYYQGADGGYSGGGDDTPDDSGGGD